MCNQKCKTKESNIWNSKTSRKTWLFGGSFVILILILHFHKWIDIFHHHHWFCATNLMDINGFLIVNPHTHQGCEEKTTTLDSKQRDFSKSLTLGKNCFFLLWLGKFTFHVKLGWPFLLLWRKANFSRKGQWGLDARFMNRNKVFDGWLME